MKAWGTLLTLLFLVVCMGCKAQEKNVKVKAPWDEWYFIFTTPKSLPVKVTLVKLLDTDGYGYVFRTIEQPQGNSIGKWSNRNSTGESQFNKAKSPPQMIKICWDSIIDKENYETTILFSPSAWEEMITPYPDVLNSTEKAYRNTMIIGLAPEGVARVWLGQYGHSDIPLTSAKITTVSDKDLDMCKGVTGSDFSRGYSNTTKEFIKDKKYPYGKW